MHLSELHGAATHLAVIAIPIYAVIVILRRAGAEHQTLEHVEPYALGFALIGVASAGITGLLVWGQAQTMLRGQHFRIGNAHFWIGIVLGVVVLALVVSRYLIARRNGATHSTSMLLGGSLALLLVFAQGYLGGRMTYDNGVGVASGGQFAQTGRGAANLEVALARGVAPAKAGEEAFSADGLGCARCHGDKAQGQRGPRLAGGVELGEFRGVHGKLLFPPKMVSDKDFAAINAYLRTLGPARGGGDGDG